MTKNEILKLRIDSESKRDLKQLAKQNNKSSSFVVRELIKIALESPYILSNTQANDGHAN